MKERLQKILSGAGICSRRAAETYIQQGRVKVNGITANLGDSADVEQDEILVDGRVIGKKARRMVYIMLNKYIASALPLVTSVTVLEPAAEVRLATPTIPVPSRSSRSTFCA